MFIEMFSKHNPAKKNRELFDREYSDEKVAKRIMRDIEYRIKNHLYNQNTLGSKVEGISRGVVEILQKNGYIVKLSGVEADVYFVLFKEAEGGGETPGLPLPWEFEE